MKHQRNFYLEYIIIFFLFFFIKNRSFVFVDLKSEFGVVSIYNTSNLIFEECKESTDICIVDPLVKTIFIEKVIIVLI